MQNQIVVIVVIVLVIAVAVAVWFSIQSRRTQNLKERFGPEYDRAVREADDRGSAEETLTDRQERVEQLNIRVLSAKEQEQSIENWRSGPVRR